MACRCTDVRRSGFSCERLSRSRFDLAFEDELRSPGGIETCQLSGSNTVRLALQSASHFVFRLVVKNGHPRYDAHQRIVSEANRNRKILALLFRSREVNCDVVFRNRLNPDSITAFYFEPVHAAILCIYVVPVVQITRNDGGFIDIEAPVALI